MHSFATYNDQKSVMQREVSGCHTSSAVVKIIKRAKAIVQTNLKSTVVCSDVCTLGGKLLEVAACLPAA